MKVRGSPAFYCWLSLSAKERVSQRTVCIDLVDFAFENYALLTPFDTKNDTKEDDFGWVWLSIFEQKYPYSRLMVERKEPTKESKMAFHKYCIFVKNSVY